MEKASQMGTREPLRITHLDEGFPKEVTRQHGGEKLRLCYQCGSCAGGCPVGKITDAYKPRHVIRMTLLGMRDRVISGESIWLCASCYACQERCPQGVEIADLMLVLRNMASEAGFTPKALVEQAASFIEKGRIAEVSSLMQRKRSSIGLPDIPLPPIDDIRKIAEKTSFTKLVEKLRGTGK